MQVMTSHQQASWTQVDWTCFFFFNHIIREIDPADRGDAKQLHDMVTKIAGEKYNVPLHCVWDSETISHWELDLEPNSEQFNAFLNNSWAT